MRHAWALFLWLTVNSSCHETTRLEADTQELRISPLRLEFDSTFVTATRTSVITVHNPARHQVDIAVSSASPFETLPSLSLGAGDSIRLAVTFAPTTATRSVGVVTIGTVEVEVSGQGVALSTCAAPTVCGSEHFDVVAERCVPDLKPDGTDCSASSSCLVEARCDRGQCVARSNSCDDGDACTLDVCSTDGCSHIDNLFSCPLPDSLCETPVCVAGAGCGKAPLPDGTPCGPQICAGAKVCINAQCVIRPVPHDQPCVEVMAGWPAGCGHLDGRGEDARLGGSPYFSATMAYDSAGRLFFTEGSTIRRLSPSGDVRTLAGAVDQPGAVNGYGPNARFRNPQILGFDPAGNLVVFEFSRTALTLRKIAPSGFVTPWVGVEFVLSALGWLPPVATLEDSGAVTVWLEESRELIRVSVSGRVTRQHADLEHVASSARLFGHLSSGPRGVWICGGDVISTRGNTPPAARKSTYYEILPSGRFEYRGEDCLEQLRNVGVVRHTLSFYAATLQRQLVDGGFEGSEVLSHKHLSYAADTSGRIAVLDNERCQIRRLTSGVSEVLAGPVEDAQLVDGLFARLLTSPRSIVARTNRLFFADADALREWTSERGVATLYVSSIGDMLGGLASSPSGHRLAMTASHPTVFDVSTSTATQLETVPFYVVPTTQYVWASDDELLIATDTELLARGADGGWNDEVISYPGRLNFSRYALGIASRGSQLVRFERDGGEQTLIDTGRPIIDLAEEPNGNIVFLHERSTTVQRLRLEISPARVEKVIDVHIQASAIAASPDGGIWLGVPQALLRLRSR